MCLDRFYRHRKLHEDFTHMPMVSTPVAMSLAAKHIPTAS